MILSNSQNLSAFGNSTRNEIPDCKAVRGSIKVTGLIEVCEKYDFKENKPILIMVNIFLK